MIGSVPVHDPPTAVSVSPTSASPVTVGNDVLFGAAGGSGTTSVSADDADAEPAPFEAVTTTANDEPMSPGEIAYNEVVAPGISEQAPSHCCHWNAYEIGAVPVHEPRVDDNTSPTPASPVTVGTDTLDGATGGGTVWRFQTWMRSLKWSAT